MKNWKTTLAGILTGVPVALSALVDAYNQGAFTGKTGLQLLLGIGITIGLALSKDHNVSGTGK